ncbi:MAG: hypothetical protein ACOCV0_05015, partial [Alkalispirochaeta sp.]
NNRIIPYPTEAKMSRWNRHALLVIDLQSDFLDDVPDPERYRRSVERGYIVTVVGDCVADTEPDHTDTLHRYGNFAFTVATSRELPDLHPLLENRLDAINSIDR